MLLLAFIWSTVIIEDKWRRNQTISDLSQRKGLFPSQIKTVRMRRKKVASTANYYYFYYYCCVVNINVPLQVQLINKVDTISCLTIIHPSMLKKSSVEWAEGGKKTESEKLEDFTGNENQDIYSYYKLVPES